MKKQLFCLLFVTVASVTVAAAQPAYDTLISHRGESVDAPENTLPAFKTAVERGFGFECDIYLTKDGRVFTFHDKTLKRTTNGAKKLLDEHTQNAAVTETVPRGRSKMSN